MESSKHAIAGQIVSQLRNDRFYIDKTSSMLSY
jgi:hypothetical protein